MQYIRGKLAKPDDLLILLDVVKEKGGKVKLHMPYHRTEVVICYDGNSFYLGEEGKKDTDPRFLFRRFLEEWVGTALQPTFEFFEGERCTGEVAITTDEIREMLEDRILSRIRSLPEHFEVVKVAREGVPSFLMAHWKTRKPISKKSIYSYGITLSELLQLIDRGLVRIKPYKMVESMPLKLRVFLTAAAVVSILYLVLPLNFIELGPFKKNEALNWGLREKILGKKEAKLPVKGCFRSPFILAEDRVINPGIDGKFGTEDDWIIELPRKGYIPTFAVPVK